MLKNASSSMWQPIGISSSSSSGAYNNQANNPTAGLTEDELERQYATYKAQFDEWIIKNKNHPDRNAYDQYVNQFKEWEAQVEKNRRAIREWKVAKTERAAAAAAASAARMEPAPSQQVEHHHQEQGQQIAGPSTTKKSGVPAANNSETSSPPLSAKSEKKKKKSKKKKAKTTAKIESGQSVSATTMDGEAENPMMAMMKLMATMAAANTPAAPPPPPVVVPPADPLSAMMMTMAMMMPMMMNAPVPPSSNNETPTKPDLSRPPPNSANNNELQRQQQGRERAFRAERVMGQQERGERRYGDLEPRGGDREMYGGGRVERFREERDESEDRGDFWYQRWLSNRQPSEAGPGGAPQPPPPHYHQQQRPMTPGPMDPWLPSQHPHPHQHMRGIRPPPPNAGPVPLMQPTTSLDRGDPYGGPMGGGSPVAYVRRANMGQRDFSINRRPPPRWE